MKAPKTDNLGGGRLLAGAGRLGDAAEESAAQKWVGRLALLCLLGLVLARGTMMESVRDAFGEDAPGLVPRDAGPATSLALDLLAGLIAIGAVYATGGSAKRNGVRARPWAAWAFLLLGAWAAASTMWAGDKFAAMVGGCNLLGGALVFWSAARLVNSWRRLRAVAGYGLALLVIYVAAGLQYRLIEAPELQREWPARRQELMREHGWNEGSFALRQFELKVNGRELARFSTSPNTYAAALVMLGLAAAGLAVQRRKDGDGAGWLIVPGAAAAGAAVVLFWTHSRTGALTAGLGALLLAALARSAWAAGLGRMRKRVFWIGAGAFAAGVLALVGHGTAHGNLVEKSLTFRWYYWVGAAALFRLGPVLGIGFGNFGQRYLGVRLAQATEEVKDPHNFLVRAFVELGVVGGVLMVAFAARWAWEACGCAAGKKAGPVEGKVEPEGHLEDPARREVALSEGRASARLALFALPLAAWTLSLCASIDWSLVGRNEAVKKLVSGPEAMAAGTAFVIVEVVRRTVGMVLVLVALAAGGLRWGGAKGAMEAKGEEARGATGAGVGSVMWDDRPAPALLRGMVVACGMFLLHNLLEFSLFETGTLSIFALLAGSVCGIRNAEAGAMEAAQGAGAAGRQLDARTPARTWGAMGIAGAVWCAAAIGLWAPTVSEAWRIEDARSFAAAASMPNAVTAYERAAQSQPLDAWPLARAARCAQYVKSADPAALLKQAIARDPTAVEYRSALAALVTSQKGADEAEARKLYGEAIALNPQDVDLRLDFAAGLLASCKDPAGAEKELAKAIALDEGLPADEPKRLGTRIYEEYGDCLARRGDMAGAKANYQRAIEMDDAKGPGDGGRLQKSAREGIERKIREIK